MNFSVQVLGAGCAMPTAKSITSAQVVTYNQTPHLIDCGEGTQIRLRQYNIPFSRIKNIFISHAHGDHFFGLFGLISTFSMLGRKTPLNIYCTQELEYAINNLFAILKQDNSFKINYIYLNPNEKTLVYQDKNIEVCSIPLVHTTPTWGFLFSEKKKEKNVIKEAISQYELSVAQIVKLKRGEDITLDDGRYLPNSQLTKNPPAQRSYLYCTDTLPVKGRLCEAAKNVDLLYHEATFLSKDVNLAKTTCHSTAKQAAEVANFIEAKKLLLGHFSTRYKTAEILNEAKTTFPQAQAAIDGLIINI